MKRLLEAEVTPHPLTTVPEVDALAAFAGAWDSSPVEGVPHLTVSPTSTFEWETDHTTVVFDLTDPATVQGINRGFVTVHVDDAAGTRTEVEPLLSTRSYDPWDPCAAAGVADAVKVLVGRVFATGATGKQSA